VQPLLRIRRAPHLQHLVGCPQEDSVTECRLENPLRITRQRPSRKQSGQARRRVVDAISLALAIGDSASITRDVTESRRGSGDRRQAAHIGASLLDDPDILKHAAGQDEMASDHRPSPPALPDCFPAISGDSRICPSSLSSFLVA
jgi:hypothetical protein